MHRKLLGICLALAVFAIVPATASATFLTDTSGGVTKLVEVGKKIKGISEGISVFEASPLKVECNENYITGTVLKAGPTVEATIEDATFQSNLTNEPTKCKSSLGNATITIPALTNSGGTGHWCMKNAAGDNFTLFGRGCNEVGEGVLTFIIDAAGIECKYIREKSVSGTFTTPANHTASTLSVINEPIFTRHGGPELFCPKEGKIKEMKFNIYTDTATSAETNVWDDLKSTEDPVWASELE